MGLGKRGNLVYVSRIDPLFVYFHFRLSILAWPKGIKIRKHESIFLTKTIKISREQRVTLPLTLIRELSRADETI